VIETYDDLPWLILGLIHESGNDTAKVTNADLHRDADTTLQTTSNIVAVPRADERDSWKDTCSKLIT
jgi:hypothetical protein